MLETFSKDWLQLADIQKIRGGPLWELVRYNLMGARLGTVLVIVDITFLHNKIPSTVGINEACYFLNSRNVNVKPNSEYPRH